MAISNGVLRFLHLADLHLMACPRRGACGRAHAACHVCIKRNILNALELRISNADTRPGLILLSGDLTEMREHGFDLRAAVEPLDSLVRSAQKLGIAIAGITGDHDGEDGTAKLRASLGWDWLLRTGEVNRETGVAVYGVEGRPNRIGAEEGLASLRRVPGEPSIVLLHGDARLVRADLGAMFDYYAMGHMHRGRIRRVGKDKRSVLGFPGHLFSYWDGDGKPWPVHVIEGTIAGNGSVDAALVSLSKELGAPETRRLFVDFSDFGRPHGTIVFENAPPASVFAEISLEATVDPQMADGAPYRNVARIPYRSRAEMSDVLARVLKRLPRDVFVSPSTGGGWRDRVADYGDAIVNHRFAEFVEKTFKRSAGTQ